jgi:serine protease Do
MQIRSRLFYTLTLITSVVFFTTHVFSQESSLIAGNQTESIRRLPGKEIVPDFRGLAKKAIPAVVSIKVQTQKKSSGSPQTQEDIFDFFNNEMWGFFNLPRRESHSPSFMGQASGVIVRPDGYILTNNHVVQEMDRITVHLHDGREFTAKVLGKDPKTDLALIKIDANDLPYLTLGNSDEAEVGQWVAAIGNPFGLQATLTVGVVSGKKRNNLDIVPNEDFIQTDAAINRGNSGGPLLTLDGEIIGINTAIATNASAGYMGIGFAIPSNMAKHVMDEIITDGKVSQGFLGINLQSMDEKLAKAFGLQKIEGALVTNIVKDSPAEKGGLEVEDIILSVNKKPIENAAALRNVVYMMKPGSQILLTIWRKGKLHELSFTIGDLADSEQAQVSNSIPTSALKGNFLGLEVSPLTPEIARSLGYTKEQGVIITRIEPTSISALAGLQKNALILSINSQKITTVDEFNQALKGISPDQPILLHIKQGNNYFFLTLQTN